MVHGLIFIETVRGPYRNGDEERGKGTFIY